MERIFGANECEKRTNFGGYKVLTQSTLSPLNVEQSLVSTMIVGTTWKLSAI